MKNQITNRNYLAPVGFKFSLSFLPTVDFYCQAANVPTISAGYPNVATPFHDYPVPPDKMQFDELSIRFLVDEDMKNFSAIQNWLRGLTKPESFSQSKDYLDAGPYQQPGQRYLNETQDATLTILTSNYNPNINIKFQGIFPISLTGLSFDVDTTDIQYFTAEATFKYTIYNIYDKNGNKLTL
jgi:hypothetical protein